MNETETDNQAATPENAAEPVADKKLKRAKQSCITLFVVSIVALLSFGQPIVYKTTADKNSGTTLNILVLLTWPVAVYALFFIVFQWKRIKKLSNTPKYLGLLGSLVLIANLGYSAIGMCCGSYKKAPFMKSQTFGPDVWNIDGKEYKIDKCYFLRVDGGDVQYTIDYEYPKAAEIKNNEQALKVALPIMVHAYRCKKYGTVSSPSKKPQPAFIGVQIFVRNENNTKGYRIAMSLDEIKKRAK